MEDAGEVCMRWSEGLVTSRGARVFLLSVDPTGNWARGALTAGLETSLDHGLVLRRQATNGQFSEFSISHSSIPLPIVCIILHLLIPSCIMWVGIAQRSAPPHLYVLCERALFPVVFKETHRRRIVGAAAHVCHRRLYGTLVVLLRYV
jgi:hypothetical protein